MKELDIAKKAVVEGGTLAFSFLDKEKHVRYKTKVDIVTDLDVRVENLIVSTLRASFPDYSIISEEHPPVSRDSEYTWIIDPIDGTSSYVSHVPHFMSVVALQKGKDLLFCVCFKPKPQQWLCVALPKAEPPVIV